MHRAAHKLAEAVVPAVAFLAAEIRNAIESDMKKWTPSRRNPGGGTAQHSFPHWYCLRQMPAAVHQSHEWDLFSSPLSLSPMYITILHRALPMRIVGRRRRKLNGLAKRMTSLRGSSVTALVLQLLRCESSTCLEWRRALRLGQPGMALLCHKFFRLHQAHGSKGWESAGIPQVACVKLDHMQHVYQHQLWGGLLEFVYSSS